MMQILFPPQMRIGADHGNPEVIAGSVTETGQGPRFTRPHRRSRLSRISRYILYVAQADESGRVSTISSPVLCNCISVNSSRPHPGELGLPRLACFRSQPEWVSRFENWSTADRDERRAAFRTIRNAEETKAQRKF